MRLSCLWIFGICAAIILFTSNSFSNRYRKMKSAWLWISIFALLAGGISGQGLPTSSGTGMNYGDWLNMASQFSMYNGDKTAFQTNPYLNLYNPYNVQNGLAGINGYPFIYAGNRGNKGPQYNQLSQYGLTFPQLYGTFGVNGYPFYSAQNPVQ